MSCSLGNNELKYYLLEVTYLWTSFSASLRRQDVYSFSSIAQIKGGSHRHLFKMPVEGDILVKERLQEKLDVMNIKAAFILIKHDYKCFHSINNTVLWNREAESQ